MGTDVFLLTKPSGSNSIQRACSQATSSAFFYAFEKMIGLIDDENKELHILGDLNCDMSKHVSDQPTKILKAIYESYQLSQLITEAHE